MKFDYRAQEQVVTLGKYHEQNPETGQQEINVTWKF